MAWCDPGVRNVTKGERTIARSKNANLPYCNKIAKYQAEGEKARVPFIQGKQCVSKKTTARKRWRSS